MAPINEEHRLNSAARDIYLTTSSVSLTVGALSWSEYLLRLKFVRENAEAGSLQASSIRQILHSDDADNEEKWPLIGSEHIDTNGNPSALKDSLLKDDNTGLLHFQAAGSTGLSQWIFHQGDVDFFPSIPHGHTTSGRPRELDTYRGWIYPADKDKQVGREPRGKIIALWNDEKFRAFASASLAHYASTFPNYIWRVSNPMRLPHRHP